jgi:glycosyltransferase involved in cell wall biosynthesis
MLGIMEKINRSARVCVILGHYEGLEYLAQQLESIQRQTYDGIHLLVADDHSTNRTFRELKKYLEVYGGEFDLIRQTERLGYTRNFLSALSACKQDFDFFAFCDQDDIWFEDKIDTAIKALETLPEGAPNLYCSTTELFSSPSGVSMGSSIIFKRPPSFKNALVQNVAGGNTMVFNRAAKQIILCCAPDYDVVSHDWWTYLAVAGAGGGIIYDSKPSMKYRQHSRNQIGSNKGLFARLQRIWMVFRGRYSNWNDTNINALQKYRSYFLTQNMDLVDEFARARQAPFVKRLRFFMSAGVYRQTWLGNVGLWAAIILKKI